MSDQNTVATEQANGTQQQQQAEDQSQQSQIAALTPEQFQAQIADRDSKLAEASEKFIAQEKSYKEIQAEFTRTRQAMAQLMGGQTQQQQQDPLAPHVAKLVAKGYDPKAARDIAETQYEMMQPVIQQMQQNNNMLQGQLLVEDAMQQAYGTNPNLFTDPDIFAQTQQQVKAFAIQGGSVTPEFARNIGLQIYALKQLAPKNGNTQQQTQPPAFRSMTGIPANMTMRQPANQQTQLPALTPEQKAAQDEILSRLKPETRAAITPNLK